MRPLRPPRLPAALVVFAAVALAGPPVSAQFTPAPSASTAPSAPPAPAPAPAPAPVAPATSADTPRPPPGPALRERGAGRRRANPASGVFFVLVIVGVLVAWVFKRLRR